MTPPEYAFIAAEPARERARGAVLALNSLGYDARQYGANSAEARGAKAVVFCGIAPDTERFVCDVLSTEDLPLARDAYAVTAPSAELAQAAATALGRAVEVVPEPLEGARRQPRAPRARLRSRPLEWLARRVGLSTETWRTRLLWIGAKSEMEAIVGAYPSLEALGRELPLSLHCLAPPDAAEELRARLPRADTVEVAFHTLPLGQALEACDFVLAPGSARLQREALHAGRLAIGAGDPCEAIRRALAAPQETLERLAQAQQELDRAYAPAAVARAWVRIFMKGNR